MNATRECKSLREEWGHLPVADLPATPKTHVQACPACGEYFSRQESLVGLLRLKLHENPDTAFEGRLLHRVRMRLDNLASLESASASVAAPPESRRWAWLAPLAAAAGVAVAVAIYQFGPVGGSASTADGSLAASPVLPPVADESSLVDVNTPTAREFTLDPDQHLKNLFRVEKTASNRMEQLVREAKESGFEVVEGLQTNRLDRPIPEALPVNNPGK
jgi:hypothetical protein